MALMCYEVKGLINGLASEIMDICCDRPQHKIFEAAFGDNWSEYRDALYEIQSWVVAELTHPWLIKAINRVADKCEDLVVLFDHKCA